VTNFQNAKIWKKNTKRPRDGVSVDKNKARREIKETKSHDIDFHVGSNTTAKG